MSAPQFSNDQGGSACSDLPGYAALKNALAAATGCGNQRFKQPDVGDYRQSRRCGLRRRLLRCEPRRPVARQPGHLCPEGQPANAFSLDASSSSNALARPPAWRCPPRTSILLYNLAAASMDYSTAIPSIPASPTRDPLRATALLLIRWLGTKSVA